MDLIQQIVNDLVDENVYGKKIYSDLTVNGETATSISDFKTKLGVKLREANGSEGGGGGDSLILSATVTFTDAQIKAFPSNYLQVVAAPGAGKYIMPVYATFKLDGTAGAYSNVNANNVFQFKRGTDYVPYTGEANLIYSWMWEDNSDVWVGFIMAFDTGYEDIGSLENKNISVGIDNISTGDFTEGNAANTLKVTLYYIEVEL